MLRQLHITGLGVIGELDIEPAPGLTVLTGETGAGKTMITVGVSLALGGRGNAQLVRSGERAAKIQARFDAPAGAEEWAEDGEVILARTIVADGRGSARIGGQLTTAAALADMGSHLVEIHGQHQSLRLLDGATQTAFLDRYAGPAHVELVRTYRAAYAGLQAARRELEALLDAARDRERMLDLLAYQVREIEAVAPQPDESEALHGEASKLGHAERLQELADAAGGSLGSDGGAADLLATTAHDLEAAADLDPDAASLARRGHALAAEIADLASEVRAYRERVAVDPARLQEVRERIAALRGLQRKYGATDAEVVAFLDRARDEVASLQTADERLATIQTEVEEATRTVETLAEAVTATRRSVAPELSIALTAHLTDLGMPGAEIDAPGGGDGAGAAGRGSGGVAVLRRPGTAVARPGQGGQRGRAVTGDARVPQRPGRPRRRADPRVRRDRRGHRWRGGAGGRSTAGPAGRHAPGSRRDPPPADRVLRRPARPRPQAARGRERRGAR